MKKIFCPALAMAVVLSISTFADAKTNLGKMCVKSPPRMKHGETVAPKGVKPPSLNFSKPSPNYVKEYVPRDKAAKDFYNRQQQINNMLLQN